jgi:hypothetical protein
MREPSWQPAARSCGDFLEKATEVTPDDVSMYFSG